MVENLGVEPTVQETPKPAYKTVSIAVFALLGGESPLSASQMKIAMKSMGHWK
jgi:hypothetical protein